jgi:DNA-directed RNA polymerase
MLKMIQEIRAGTRLNPPAQTWAKVVLGVASLGKEDPENDAWEGWRAKAERLVHQWESFQALATGVNQHTGHAALEKDGLKVYQAWLGGMVKSRTPLDPLVPYIQSGLFIGDLMEGMAPSDHPAAFEALLSLAGKYAMKDLEDATVWMKSHKEAEREQKAAAVIEEAKPVTTVSLGTIAQEKC